MGLGYITGYFPGLDPLVIERFQKLEGLYEFWNSKINVISRKDLSNLYLNHVLHSLSLARVIQFEDSDMVLDIGTGGGFPGIPLAIMFPCVNFTLIDSTGKKIMVVDAIARELKLQNIDALHVRAENFHSRFHYIVSRAVCSFPRLVELSSGKLVQGRPDRPYSGIYSLKGGDLTDELAEWENSVKVYQIRNLFSEEYFLTKSIVFLPSGHI